MTRKLLSFFVPIALFAAISHAEPEAIEGAPPAVVAARAQAAVFEKEGFVFREDHWESVVTSERGKAVRIQLFKGHEYRVCVAADPENTINAKLESHIVAADGKPIENENVVGEDGMTVNLRVSPKRTGVHLILVRLDKGEGREDEVVEANCALVIGYR